MSEKFGRWTVLNVPGNWVPYGKGESSRWLCRCECGVERLVRGRSLLAGSSKSCGCARPTNPVRRQKLKARAAARQAARQAARSAELALIGVPATRKQPSADELLAGLLKLAGSQPLRARHLSAIRIALRDGKVDASRLATEANVTKGTATKTVHELLNHGLLERGRDLNEGFLAVDFT